MNKKIVAIAMTSIFLMMSLIFIAPVSAHSYYVYQDKYGISPINGTAIFGNVRIQPIKWNMDVFDTYVDYTAGLDGIYTLSGEQVSVGLVSTWFGGDDWGPVRVYVKWIDSQGAGHWYDTPIYVQYGSQVQIGMGQNGNSWQFYYNTGGNWNQFYSANFGHNLYINHIYTEFYSQHSPWNTGVELGYVYGIYYQTSGWTWHFGEWHQNIGSNEYPNDWIDVSNGYSYSRADCP